MTAVNDAPVAANDAYSTNEDTALNVAAAGVLANDSDVDGDALTAILVSSPAHGSVTLNANGSFTYTPAANYNGGDSFTYKANDGALNSNVATVSITVTAVNDAPVANAQSATTAEDTAKAITLTASDVDGDTLTYSIVSGPLHGSLSGTAPNVTYTPAANYNGPDSFTFNANDSTIDSNVATVSVTVTAVNDAPSFTKGANQSVMKDSGAQTVAGWASAISAGPADESSQALNFIVTNDNTGLFSAQPAISPTGTLTYTSAAGATGSATVTVQLHDDGGTANGGADTSAAQTFTITITPPPTLTINDVSQLEGNSGVTPFVFTISLNPAATVNVTVNYQTLNGTAATPRDYTAASGTLTFTPGQTSKTVTVNVNGDTTKENNETFALRLSNAVNAILGDNEGLGTILDDDNTPHMSVSSTSLVEGNNGQKSMVMAVSPTNDSAWPMTVDYTTSAGTAAREGIDYLPVTGTLTFPPETLDPQFIVIPVVGNLRHQPNHKVLVHLMNAVQAVLDGIDGVGDIVDDDPVPTISISDVTVGEANSGTVNAVLTVSLSNDTDDVVTVNYSTVDGSAVANNDYIPVSGTLTFQPGQMSQVITIAVNAASVGELTESFNVDLSGVTGATMNKSRGIVTITPPTSWVTTTVAEFGAGMLAAGGYLADTAGGEITLAPTVGAEFAGTALPSGWTSSVLQTGGGASVANGMVTVDGASVLSPTVYTAGHTLEFVARFSGAADQNAGFGLTSALLPPFAMFGVKADGQLYARSVAPGQAIETPIPGSWFTAPHRFRIDWNATSVVYWIDGTQRVSHTITYKGATASMKPAITDLTAGSGALTVDWMRMSAYTASGSYTSPVYNAGAPVNWQALSWTADSVAGNSIVVEARTGNASTPDASWTAFRAVTSGQAIAATSQYAQYRVTLSTTVSNATPAVKEVVLTFLR
ncbi:MAG: hypothetical protein DMG02_20530 [Acidobacteria bacterium]|nr:MAG: hypothetical protein DMG02_20530 [Acidobacteriota bacterium]